MGVSELDTPKVSDCEAVRACDAVSDTVPDGEKVDACDELSVARWLGDTERVTEGDPVGLAVLVAPWLPLAAPLGVGEELPVEICEPDAPKLRAWVGVIACETVGVDVAADDPVPLCVTLAVNA